MKLLKRINRKFNTLPANLNRRYYRFFVAVNYLCLIGAFSHFSYIVTFSLLNNRFLVLYNIGSTIFFLGCINCFLKGKFIKTACCLVLLELCTHQILCSIIFGWHTGFYYYMAAIPLYIAMTPFWKLSVRMVITLLVFMAYCLTFHVSQSAYQELDKHTEYALYLINVFSFFLLLGAAGLYYSNAAEKAEKSLEEEHLKSESLLKNILPTSIAERLKGESDIIADNFKEATILFSDLVGFTKLSGNMRPEELVKLLNTIFTRFDKLSKKYGLEKIKTIGDAYMVVSGLPESRDDHAHAMAEMALEMMEIVKEINRQLGMDLHIRVGVNSGAVVAGVIGKAKFSYDLWGDSVNTAARMESHGLPGKIQVTESTYMLLKNKFIFEDRGRIHIKGKGEMKTYFLKGALSNSTRLDSLHPQAGKAG